MKRHTVTSRTTRISLTLSIIAGISIGLLFGPSHASDLQAEQTVVNAWNGLCKSIDAQNSALLTLQTDYHQYPPLRFAFADPELRKAQRERRVKTWDAIIREQEISLEYMKQARKAEGEY